MTNKLIACVVGFALGLMAQSTLANTITIALELDGDTITKGGAPWSASCAETGAGPCMEGFVGAATASMSTVIATAYDKPGNPLAELTLLNSLLGLSGAGAITGTADIADAGNSFETNYRYFGIKQSSYIMYFENLTDAPLDVTFINEFSHVTGFGEQLNNVPQVPLPAAVWMFGSALFGLSAVARRKKRM